ncbi:MAG: cytochrome c maturation protein CcmE [Anaerolineae bacterium]|nr:cytochrome c maturation protein CcmE [Anaerolineae bacterium]MDW8172867.1 cytochrome c maturation protein CcmE [Anaerolineae bacterium]
MAQLAWEKTSEVAEKRKNRLGGERLKFLIGGLLVVGAVIHLVLNSTISGARFFVSVADVVNNPQHVGQTVRLTGAVVGDTIQYNPVTGDLSFVIAHIQEPYSDIAQALHLAANDPQALRLHIYMSNQALPDLLRHEAQAILTGKLGEDGAFVATELLLKCPSRFEEKTPGQMRVQED